MFWCGEGFVTSKKRPSLRDAPLFVAFIAHTTCMYWGFGRCSTPTISQSKPNNTPRSQPSERERPEPAG